MDKNLLPAKRFVSHDQTTTRYFVEKFPVFLAPSTSPVAPPVVSFCFVDAGSAGLSEYWGFLDHYHPLFTQLREFRVIYVAGSDRHFQAAAKAFGRFLNRDKNRSLFDSTAPRATRLLEHFELRHLYETQRGTRLTGPN